MSARAWISRCALSAVLSASAAAAGCGGPAAARGGDSRGIVDLTDPAQPLPVERFVKPASAHIAPGDELDLRVIGFADLSGKYLVAQDGRINLGLVGTIEAAGKSADELDREITQAFGQYYRNIDVAVNVNVRAERNVYVLGEVLRPGRYDFRTGERVLHALASGGGLTPKARESSVILLRREADGRDHVYRLDFGRIHDQLAPKDIYLQPSDVVFVPKGKFQTVTDFSNALLEVLGRASSTALIIDDLQDRTRSLTISR